MDLKEAEKAIEAILFASGDPVEPDRICSALGIDRRTLNGIIEHMQESYSRDRGIALIRLEDRLQLCTKPEYADMVRSVVSQRKPARLSDSAMETLAIIAYNQPVTKAYIEQIRGVDCSYAIAGLMEKGLVEERGRLDAPGRPILFGVTDNFLRCFGIRDTSQLPRPEGEGALEGAVDA